MPETIIVEFQVKVYEEYRAYEPLSEYTFQVRAEWSALKCLQLGEAYARTYSAALAEAWAAYTNNQLTPEDAE